MENMIFIIAFVSFALFFGGVDFLLCRNAHKDLKKVIRKTNVIFTTFAAISVFAFIIKFCIQGNIPSYKIVVIDVILNIVFILLTNAMLLPKNLVSPDEDPYNSPRYHWFSYMSFGCVLFIFCSLCFCAITIILMFFPDVAKMHL